MLLTITTTHQPATDLGFLLMKHPDNVHVVDLSFGKATLFYPEATEERCTAAITLDVDAVELVRGKGSIEDQYVNDRPYAASSLLSVALGRLLNTAMGGRSKLRQELADQPIPLEATITPLPARGGLDLLERMFAPLGYAVEVSAIPLDPAHPDWGNSPYVTLKLSGRVRVAALLTHLFVLIPVLDNNKHYYVGEAEVEKLLRKGEGWLETHPDRELIVRRYLRGFGGLVRKARQQLDERVEAEEVEEHAARDSAVEVAPRVLAGAGDRLKLDHMPDIKRQRIELLQGSLVYRDDRLKGFDVAAVIEVIEHMETERLPAFEVNVFGHARPGAVIVTTPNREYNALFEGMKPEAMRHPDHRFEWTRAEFRHWAESVGLAYGYAVRFDGIGAEDATHGHPTQVAIFTRMDEAKAAA